MGVRSWLGRFREKGAGCRRSGCLRAGRGVGGRCFCGRRFGSAGGVRPLAPDMAAVPARAYGGAEAALRARGSDAAGRPRVPGSRLGRRGARSSGTARGNGACTSAGGSGAAGRTRIVRHGGDACTDDPSVGRVLQRCLRATGAIPACDGGCFRRRMRAAASARLTVRPLACTAGRTDQSRWKTSSATAHHSPSARVSSGCWQGMQTAHQRCVSGSAAILAMSAS